MTSEWIQPNLAPRPYARHTPGADRSPERFLHALPDLANCCALHVYIHRNPDNQEKSGWNATPIRDGREKHLHRPSGRRRTGSDSWSGKGPGWAPEGPARVLLGVGGGAAIKTRKKGNMSFPLFSHGSFFCLALPRASFHPCPGQRGRQAPVLVPLGHLIVNGHSDCWQSAGKTLAMSGLTTGCLRREGTQGPKNRSWNHGPANSGQSPP